jgi:TonB family protein
MSAHILTLGYDRRDSIGGNLFLSIGLHVLLFLSAVGYAAFGRHFGGGWGQKWGTGGDTRVNAVASLPGVPLPAPLLSTRNTLATQNPGLYQTEPEPTKPEPAPKAQEIPKFKGAVKPEKAERINKRIQKEELVTPENAIPYGLGGKPAMNYVQVVTQAGEGALSFGEGGGFGERYGWYVAAVRNRVSSNWLLSTISPSILTAPRVYLTFEILRDGSIADVQVTQPSGIAEVDRSALRAVLASNPLAPLPPDYAGGRVKVEFYFDFHRGR